MGEAKRRAEADLQVPRLQVGEASGMLYRHSETGQTMLVLVGPDYRNPSITRETVYPVGVVVELIQRLFAREAEGETPNPELPPEAA